MKVIKFTHTVGYFWADHFIVNQLDFNTSEIFCSKIFSILV